MGRRSKLLAALDAYQGRDLDREQQVKFQKKALKRKRSQPAENGLVDDDMDQVDTREGQSPKEYPDRKDSQLAGEPLQPEHARSPPPQSENEEVEEAIPLSDIDSSSSNENDAIPFQRVTINNPKALLSAYKSFVIASDLPFSSHYCLTTISPVRIEDVNDDLSRELTFYQQCLDGAERGRQMLKAEDIPVTRPIDYFAEMVKSDEHMEKIRRQMVDEAARKRAAQEAKKQRELKKFGKQTQIAKEQERAKTKRATLDKISSLKRKRKNAEVGNENEAEQFDIALEQVHHKKEGKAASRDGKNRLVGSKRQRKNEKFGFGGQKRGRKHGDTFSSGDVSGYSGRKAGSSKAKTKRPGKSRRSNHP